MKKIITMFNIGVAAIGFGTAVKYVISAGMAAEFGTMAAILGATCAVSLIGTWIAVSAWQNAQNKREAKMAKLWSEAYRNAYLNRVH